MTMLRNGYNVLIALMLLLCSGMSLQAQEYRLRYALPKDATYKFKQKERTTALAQSNDGRSTEIDRSTTRYFTMTVTGTTDDAVSYTVVQDTAIVEENNEDPRVQRQNLLMQNILTGKAVTVRQSTTGAIEETRARTPLGAQDILGPTVSDAMFTAKAALLPQLPGRPLRIGMTWTEEHRDTLRPSKTLPGIGSGSGIRYLDRRTEFTVVGTETLRGIECLALKWQTTGSMEEALLYDGLEEYAEEFRSGSGEMKISLDSGLPLWIEIYSDEESTHAMFGKQNSVVPASINTHTTLELFSQ